MPEARITDTEHGPVPEGEGWFVLDATKAAWKENARYGRWISFEGDVRFPALGVNIHVLEPGQAACMYHKEDAQEDFLVLSGTCRLLVENEERLLGPWSFFHCPPNTEHVFVGAGDGPCAILMIGERKPSFTYLYPENELAAKYGASAAKTTPDPREAYADRPPTTSIPSPWPLD